MEKTAAYKNAFSKAAKYCAIQDRCISEVLHKVRDIALTEAQLDLLIDELTTQKFLDQERFCRQFVNGKFKIKQWGKIKISHNLRQKQIPIGLINRALEVIDDSEYYDCAYQLALKKNKNTDTDDFLKRRFKITNYLLSKGYEQHLVYDVVQQVLKDDEL